MKANFNFFIRKKVFFAMDLIWCSEKIIKFGVDLIWHSEKKIKLGDFCHFAPIAPNFLSIKIYLNKLYCSIFRILIYSISDAYLKPCQIFKIMRHIENPGIFVTVYSCIFRHIQGHSAMLNHVQVCWGMLRGYLGIFSYYWGIFSHIQTYSELCVTLAYTAVPYSKPWYN